MKLRQIFRESNNNEIEDYVKKSYTKNELPPTLSNKDFKIVDGKIEFSTTVELRVGTEKSIMDDDYNHYRYPIRSVEGDFYDSTGTLSSLKNFPETVKGNIELKNSKLDNLKNNYKINCRMFEIDQNGEPLDLEGMAIEAKRYVFNNCITSLKDFPKNNTSKIWIRPSGDEFEDSIINYPNPIVLILNKTMIDAGNYPLLDIIYFDDKKRLSGDDLIVGGERAGVKLDDILKKYHGKGNSVVVEFTEELINVGLERNARFSF
jgi:hypothetical protein